MPVPYGLGAPGPFRSATVPRASPCDLSSGARNIFHRWSTARAGSSFDNCVRRRRNRIWIVADSVGDLKTVGQLADAVQQPSKSFDPTRTLEADNRTDAPRVACVLGWTARADDRSVAVGGTVARNSAPGLLVVAGLLISAVIASVPAAGAQTTASSHSASAEAQVSTAPAACGKVLFIGARGSGESGPGTPGWKAKSTDPYGLGARVNSAYQALVKDLGNRQTLLPVSVAYRADSVDLLWSDPFAYFSDLAAGVSYALAYLRADAMTCPNQRIILAGYSQGAMVMHRVLRDLGDTPQDQAILARVVDAILIADGDQVPNDNDITRYGTAPLNARGAGLAFQKLSGSSPAKLASDVGARVLSICNNHDPVCAWTDTNLRCKIINTAYCKSLGAIHSNYTGTKPVLAAVSRTADDLLGQVNWSAAQAKMPANISGYTTVVINAVTCASTTVCVAVGFDESQNSTAPSYGLIWWRSGAHWNVTEAPLPADAHGYEDVNLTAVSCVSTTACLIVGNYYTATGSYGLLLSGYGSSWVSQAVNPGEPASGPDTYLNSVQCLSLQTCVVVGVYRNTAHNYRGLVLWGGGLSWKISQVGLPAGANPADYEELNSVACRSTGACIAVGDYEDATTGPDWYPLIASGAGTSWQSATAPLPLSPSGYPDSTLGSVTCPSTAHCLAFGLDFGAAALLWSSGPSWAGALAPLASGTSGDWSLETGQVACVSQDECLLGGTVQPSSSSLLTPTLWTGSGTSWSRVVPPLPGNALPSQGGRLDTVTCAAGDKCLAFGGYSDASFTWRGMIISGIGSSWAAQSMPVPSGISVEGSRYLSIDAAYCVSASDCVAVGSYQPNASSTASKGLLLIEQPIEQPS